MSTRGSRNNADLDGGSGFGDDSDDDNRSSLDLVVEDISPSLAPQNKISVSALMTKQIVKVTFVAIGIVLIFGFIHAVQYPRIRTEWEYQIPTLRRREGVPVVYDRITSPIPCTPEKLTDRWAAYNKYKEASLKGNHPPQVKGELPTCSVTDIQVDQDPACWVLAPSEGCNPHITWQDLHDQRDEVFQQVDGVEVQGVYPSDPTGEISTTFRLAKGSRRTYSCTTAIARNRYAGNEEWGQWERMSNCSFVTINGVEAVELQITKRALALKDVVATHKVTLLTKWPTSRKREYQAFFRSVSPTVDNSSAPRTQRSLPAYKPPSITERAGGCPHRTTEKWFRWTVGITKPGRKIKPYPPGLQWIGKQSLAGQRTLYFVETPVLSPDQVGKIEGSWGSDVLDTLLDCVANKLDPLDRPWRDLDRDQFTKYLSRHIGEMIPICREPSSFGIRKGKAWWSVEFGTKGASASCRISFRDQLRRFRVSGTSPYWLNNTRHGQFTAEEYKRWDPKTERAVWENYAGLREGAWAPQNLGPNRRRRNRKVPRAR